MVTFSFVERSLIGTTDHWWTLEYWLGEVLVTSPPGISLTVTVQSSEPVPTVQFGTSSLRHR